MSSINLMDKREKDGPGKIGQSRGCVAPSTDRTNVMGLEHNNGGKWRIRMKC